MTFQGISPAALDFYRELEQHNERAWWLANKQRYLDEVRAAMEYLAEAVGPLFGEAKVYRPYRDVRFSDDKTPYKTHQGIWVHTMHAAGYYFHLDASGIMLGGGAYWLAGDQVARYRSAVSNDATGVQLEAILRELTEAGYEVGGEQLATRPRGVAADAPRLDLLRRKAINVHLTLGAPDWMSTPDLAEYLHDGWDEVRPLVEWLGQYVGASESPGRR